MGGYLYTFTLDSAFSGAVSKEGWGKVRELTSLKAALNACGTEAVPVAPQRRDRSNVQSVQFGAFVRVGTPFKAILGLVAELHKNKAVQSPEMRHLI